MKTMMDKNTAADNGQGGVMKIVAILVAIVVVALIGWGAYKMLGSAGTNDAPKTEGYQAVFLSNGQVYFGRVSGLEKDYAELTEVYYLMRKTPLQNQVPAEGDAAAQQSQLTLIKLGNELHGPKDQMILNQKHILFVENLKDDSKIVAAINDYKTKQEGEQK